MKKVAAVMVLLALGAIGWAAVAIPRHVREQRRFENARMDQLMGAMQGVQKELMEGRRAPKQVEALVVKHGRVDRGDVYSPHSAALTFADGTVVPMEADFVPEGGSLALTRLTLLAPGGRIELPTQEERKP